MQSNTQDLSRREITRSGVGPNGELLESVPNWDCQYRAPELKGRQFGKLTIVSDTVLVVHKHDKHSSSCRFVLTQCLCGIRAWKYLDNVSRGVAGCRSCGHPRRAPKWLVSRAINAKDRCENPKNKMFKRYGGRGIRFCFPGPTAMAVWIMENLENWSDRTRQIDRIDNNGNYEPGNLRMATAQLNVLNRRSRLTLAVTLFRQRHPEILYADSTLAGMIGKGLTDEEIVARFRQPSCKPKGVYGTFSTLAPDIVSQLTGS